MAGGGGEGGAGSGAGEDDESGGDVPPAARVVCPADVTLVAPGVEEVCHVGTSGAKVTVLSGLAPAAGARALRLRSNLVASTAGVAALAGGLEELELYDNLLARLPGVAACTRLRVLDLSYNRLPSLDELLGGGVEAGADAGASAEADADAGVDARAVSPAARAAALPALDTLYAASNRLRALDGVRAAPALRVLDVGDNALRSLDGLGAACPLLEELWAGKNKLASLAGAQLDGLARLRILDVQSNRLVSLAGLAGGRMLAGLRELYAAFNGLGRADAGGEGLARALDGAVALEVLDVSSNGLTTLDGLAGLRALTDLWAGGNALASLDAARVASDLAGLPALAVLYLEGNPAARDWEYRLAVARALPRLRQLDAGEIKRAGV